MSSHHSAKLNHTTIKQIHEMRRQGLSMPQIAAELGVHRNTIGNHLRRMVEYSEASLAELQGLDELPQDAPLVLAKAALLLPGRPSRKKIERLIKGGLLDVTLDRSRSEVNVDRLVTTIDSVKRLASQMLPRGFYIASRSVKAWGTSDLASFCKEEFASEARHLVFWPSADFLYFPAASVFGVARAIREPLFPPAAAVHRAITAHRITGVGTL